MLFELYNIVYVPTFYFNIGYNNLNSSGRKTPVCLLLSVEVCVVMVVCGCCGGGGLINVVVAVGVVFHGARVTRLFFTIM